MKKILTVLQYFDGASDFDKVKSADLWCRMYKREICIHHLC